MSLIASIMLVCLSALLALANISGCVAAQRRARQNIPGGYSTVAGVSLVFSMLAWLTARELLGPWALAAFIPALLDPGTWSLAYLPIFLIRERLLAKRSGPER